MLWCLWLFLTIKGSFRCEYFMPSSDVVFQVFLFSQLWHILDLEDCSWRGLLKSASLLFFRLLLLCPFSIILYGMWLFWVQSRRERTHSCKESLIWWNESDFGALGILLILNDFCRYLILLLMGSCDSLKDPILILLMVDTSSCYAHNLLPRPLDSDG